MRVWVDLTNSAHPIVLRPLVELLEAGGHEVELTARPLSQTTELLDDWGHPYDAMGRHGGASRLGKARAAAERIPALLRWTKGRRFDWALAHGSTDLPVVARIRRIPNTTMLDYEWAVLQQTVNCRLANRVLVPDVIPAGLLARYGARPPKLVQYPGLKEDYYLSGFEPDRGVLDELGVDPSRVLCVVRTAPSYALYLGGSENELLTRLLERLASEDAQTVVLARIDEQRQAIRSLGDFVVPDRAVDARSLVAFADAVVSAGGTMTREAAALGTPAWSIFEGRPAAVDAELARQGRVKFLRAPDELELRKVEQRVPRPRRNPADLLRLAIPTA